MPRARLKIPRNPPQPSRIPAILRTRDRKLGPAGETILPNTPRLWNAKRRIKTNRGLSERQLSQYLKARKLSQLLKQPEDESLWRAHVSPDVASFIDTTYPPLTQGQKTSLLRSPHDYFSRPHRVPLFQRKQIYFPDFSVTLLRSPHNPPSLAAFKVPLWFSKLDLKDYLLSLYSVSVLHIRSWVQPNRIVREEPLNRRRQGRLKRPKAKKKMTVQLAEPFVWPEEVTEFEEWEKEEYWRVAKAQVDLQREQGQIGEMMPKRRHRKSVAEQARELVEGKKVWQPTWMSIPSDERVLKGVADIKPSPRRLPIALQQHLLPAARQPLRRIPIETSRAGRKVLPIDAPVKEMAELRV